MPLNENNCDGFNQFIRVSPLIIVAASLVLDLASKELIEYILEIVSTNEHHSCNDGTWGGFVYVASASVVDMFIKLVLESDFEDSAEQVVFLQQLLHSVTRATLREHGDDLEFRWEKASIPSQFLAIAAMTDGYNIKNLLVMYAQPIPVAIDLARQPGERWLSHIASYYNAWPYFKRVKLPDDYVDGECYQRLTYSTVVIPIGTWPSVRDVRNKYRHNPFARCVQVGSDSWHVLHVNDKFDDRCKIFRDLPPEARVGGYGNSQHGVYSTDLSLTTDMSHFSALLREMRRGKDTGLEVSGADFDTPVAPFSTFFHLEGYKRDGYFVSPMVLSSPRGRCSFSYDFDLTLKTAYLRLVPGLWHTVDVIAGSVNFSVKTRYPILLVLVYAESQVVELAPVVPFSVISN